jgi:multiple sugar transport system substrate-binding protein
MKKVLPAILTTMLLLGVLAGCAAAAPQRITFWHVFSETFGGPQIAEMVDAFNASQNEVEVIPVFNPDMYPGLMRNLQAEVAAGSYPSLTVTGYSFLDFFAGNFEFKDIRSLDAAWLDEVFPVNIQGLASVGGSQVGIPKAISAPILLYNADIFEEAGIAAPPATWQEVRELARRINQATGKIGFYMQEHADNWAVQGLLESNGVRMLTDGVATFATPAAAEAYQILADMVLVDRSALHISASEGIDAFVAGEVGMLLVTSGRLSAITASVSFNLAAATFPSFPGHDIRIPAGGFFIAVTGQTEAEQQAGMKFLRFIMQPEIHAKWSATMGYLPTRGGLEAELDAFLGEGTLADLWRITNSQMPYVHQWVSYPGDIGTFAEQLLADTRDRILGGVEDPSTALQNAQNLLNGRLAAFR